MKNSIISAFLKMAVFIAILACQSVYSADTEGKTALAKGVDKYKKYIENSTWVVPPKTLQAYQYLNGQTVGVLDQTVWVINRFEHGYFFGNSYTAINAAPTSQMNLVGSITPEGNVYITFYPVSGNLLSSDVVNGIGKFRKKDGHHYFTMQMNSAQNELQGLSHWSYMIKVRPKDYFYKHLPGVDISVPQFITQFNG